MHGETKRRAEKGAPANPLGRRPFLIRAECVRFMPYLCILYTYSFLLVTLWFTFSSPQNVYGSCIMGFAF